MIRIEPGPIAGHATAPPSKSATHRAYLLASQAETPALVASPLRAADTDATLVCLHRLGARLTLEPDGVRFNPATLMAPTEALDCRNSGTTLRFLAATAARLGAPVHLMGDASLSRRNSTPLWDALAQLGAHVESPNGCPPVRVKGPIHPGSVVLPPHASSQFASALALSLPFLDAPSILRLTGPVDSAPYLDVTFQMARQQGLHVQRSVEPDGKTWVFQPSKPRGGRIVIEGDWSSSAFLLVAGVLTGSVVEVGGLDADSTQPDRAIMRILEAFGAGSGRLVSPGRVDVRAAPDLFPILAALAAFSEGTTRFVGGSQLRNKESDRIEAMAENLRRMGIHVSETPDGFVVEGGHPHGAILHTHGDHRIHMALAVAALAADGPSHLDGEETVAGSYPGFHAVLASLGARIFKHGETLEATA